MNRRTRRSRGYSLSELLTIVAIVGLISLIAIPAFMQLLPQFRMRSAASEIASSMRMLRAKAISTRGNWSMTVDATNDSYRMQRFDGTVVGENGRPIPTGQSQDKYLTQVNVTTGGTITFQRDGTAAATQSIVLQTSNTFVRFNRYTITVDASGNVSIVPSKV